MFALVGVLGVDLGAPQEGQVERRAGRGAVGDVGALRVDAVRLGFVLLVAFAGVPGAGVSVAGGEDEGARTSMIAVGSSGGESC